MIWKSFIYECENERCERRWEWGVIKTMHNTTVPKLPTELRWCSHGGDYKHYGLMGCDCIRTGKHLPTFQWYVLPPSTEHWVFRLSRWRLYLALKHQCISTRLHGITTSMTAIQHLSQLYTLLTSYSGTIFMFAPCIFSIKILLLKSNKFTSLVTSTLNKIKVTIKSHNKNSNMFRFTQEPSSGSPPVLG
jgi:hypothetical protein